MGLYLSAKAEIRNEYWNFTFLADLSRITNRHLERQQQIEIRDAFTNLGDTVSTVLITLTELLLFRAYLSMRNAIYIR